MRKRHILTVFFSFVFMFFCVIPANAAELTSIQLEIKLDITGEIPSSTESFTFVLEAIGDAPVPENNTVTISGKGSGRFSPIIYTKPETYHYTVQQIIGAAEGYVYDDKVYDLTVQVTTNDSGSLNAVLLVYEQGNSRKTNQIMFTNQYLLATIDNTPQTDDTTDVVLWSALGIISLLGIIVSIKIDISRH